MKNKKSVLFVEPENMLTPALAIKKELIKDASYAGIVISEKKLRCTLKNMIFDKLFPEGNGARNLYKKLRKSRFKRKPEMMTYGESCGLPQKTVRNLLYRFVPDIVVVSTEEALRSIIVERRKLGIKCNLGVLCKENVNADIVSEEVDFYLVDDQTGKNKLLDLHAPDERIIPGTSVSLGEIAEEEKRSHAKELFGVNEKKVILYLVEGCSGIIRERIGELLATKNESVENFFLCGADEQTAEFVSSHGGCVISEMNTDNILTASDLVMYTTESELYEKAKEKNRTTLVIDPEKKLSDSVETELSKMREAAIPTPHVYYADFLQRFLGQKRITEEIDSDDIGSWTLEKSDDDD